ncbi:hypothetical protein ACFE04_012401 [Oxalis oulophora]
MDYRHRRILLQTYIPSVCQTSCDPSSIPSSCFPGCEYFCPSICTASTVPYVYTIPPPSPIPNSSSSPSGGVTVACVVIVMSILIVFFCVIFSKTQSRSSLSQTNETNAVYKGAIFKYKRGDGLIEGTECSVCLNEFKEEESLRLLPECSHAFHTPCIDTWLISHTSCPNCRAPLVKPSVVTETVTTSSINDRNSDDGNEESGRELGSQGRDVTSEASETILMRRSVSLDSLSTRESSNGTSSQHGLMRSLSVDLKREL